MLKISGTQLGLMLQAVAAFSFAIIISLISSWKLTMVVVLFLPLLFTAGITHGRNMKGAHAERASHAESGSKVNEMLFISRRYCIDSLIYFI